MIPRWKLISIFLVVFLVVFLGRKTDVNQKEAPEPIRYQKAFNLTFLQPFNLFFQRNDFHVIVYFEGHPEYEAVEAMIKEREEKEPFIWAIITRHNQTQIDHINDEKAVEKIAEERRLLESQRQVFYTPIQFSRTEVNGKLRILLEFVSFKGENIVFDLYTVARPNSKYGGLTDPEGHAKTTSLPVMWRERSTLASPKSRITFDGKEYEIPVRIWIPIFFKGMKGYYTEGFSMGVISTGDVTLELVKAPERIEVGEEWIYRTANEEVRYRVIERNGDQIVIQEISGVSEVSETITARVVDNHLEIGEIRLASSEEEGFSIMFNPPLPAITALPEGVSTTSRFSISIAEHKGLVTGEIIVRREPDRILLNLNPERPNWAVKRAMQIAISSEDNKYRIESAIKDTR